MLGVILFICIAVGGYAMVKTIANGASRVGSHVCPAAKHIFIDGEKDGVRRSVEDSDRVWNQGCIEDLRGAFVLYQTGALTKDEFEKVKAHLLSKLKARTWNT
ncbi:MAG: hypothetical protein P4M06_07425 [Pandoraea sp.]|nr:hypothetical protein [Pandoraea sp.]MDR3397378.1 hypothetical protein [Pandoraea sp.]